MYSENMLWNQHDTRGSGRMAKTITEPRRKIKMDRGCPEAGDFNERISNHAMQDDFVLRALCGKGRCGEKDARKRSD